MRIAVILVVVLASQVFRGQALPKDKKSRKNWKSVEEYLENRSPNDVSSNANGCDLRHHLNHDPSRIPEYIPHITCHEDAGQRCVQIYLPMEVSYSGKKSKKTKGCLDNAENKIIQVPSGCYLKTTLKRS